MSEIQRVHQTDSLDTSKEPRSWGSAAAALAYEIAVLNRGDLAILRRMDPSALDNSVIWRLLAQNELLSNPVVETKWGLVVHGIALMTKSSGVDSKDRSAHDAKVPVGKALFWGGDSNRPKAIYSASRFNRLMTARGPMLRTLMLRMFRILARTGQAFDWREMARWILSEGHDESNSEKLRRGIARHYYLAEYTANRQENSQQQQSN